MQKVRINKYDNLKGLAILMIVFWHLRTLNVFPDITTKFFMISALPIFFFVAGYFSKTTPDQPVKIFKRLLVPYLIFTVFFKLFRYLLTGKASISMLFINTETGLWFLLALFIMKLILPMVEKFRYPILTSFIFALFFGFLDVDHNLLGLTRGVAYFPIFLVGFYYESLKEKFIRTLPKVSGFFEKHYIVLFVLTLAVTILIINGLDFRHMLFNSQYKGNLLYEMIKRAIVIFVEIIFVLMLNRAMTNRYTFLTKMGINSMAVYLLHLFVLILKQNSPRLYIANDVITMIINVILIFALTFVLSRDPVTKYLNRFTDYVAGLILKPES